ncbi:MAG: UPF0182 family protein [Gemmatimonadota bacterium]|nr:UPF0182 family protein [Gemmatimonadota bacterium]
MTRGQRLTAVIAAAAAVLLVGRGAAILYSDQEWYANLGAVSVWNDRMASTMWLFGLAIVVGTAFAWVNVSAVRRSVAALIVPKRIGNVQFGEEVPSARLRALTGAVSVAVALVSLYGLPSWTTIALWRSNVAFAESDPYFTLDLSHFVAWLPLEIGAYQWCVTLFAITSILVVGLYSLTPSLSWDSSGLHVTPHTRRHISALGALLLVLAAWAFRLDAFRELVHGSGVDGLFTRTDHAFIIPLDLALSLLSLGAAVVLLIAGWMGQTTTALISVSVVIIGTVASQVIGPWISARVAANPANSQSERPYVETRGDFNLRAYPQETIPQSIHFLADSTLLANAGQIQIRGALPDIVFPGAIGVAVVSDPSRLISAPRLGTGLARFMHAWSEQNLQMLSGDVKSSDAFVRERDIRARVAALAPALAMSTAIGAIPTSRGILWIVDLYSISETYPLSAPRQAGTTRMTYRHHVATAYVSGGTAATIIVPDSALDPVARAWFGAHPGRYIAPRVPPQLLAPPPVPPAQPSGSTPEDQLFRQNVNRIYDRMRASLDSGNLRAFGATFDTLGMVVKGRQ